MSRALYRCYCYHRAPRPASGRFQRPHQHTGKRIVRVVLSCPVQFLAATDTIDADADGPAPSRAVTRPGELGYGRLRRVADCGCGCRVVATLIDWLICYSQPNELPIDRSTGGQTGRATC